MRKLKIAVPCVAALTLALAACGGGDSNGSGGGGEQQHSSAVQTTSQEPAQGTAQTSGNSGQTLASREFQDESLGKAIPMRLDITGLQRQGELATLNFTVTNMSEEASWSPHIKFGESKTPPLSFDLSGVSLVDPKNAKRYRVARGGGSDGPCVCTETRTITIAKGGGTASFYATFPAPPADLKVINVEIPLVGVINDVPIS